ncbi:hypothetical protein BDV93DRAFT_607094 [Ceratobasidium sp. AG-I]|nr:hypothetical protein BDV93DRAFT_607094 [Ceratobasidium sp. AG-I]
MSVSEGSTNNKAPASTLRCESYIRDPRYYHDTNSVFRVGESLFKFQASILAPNPSTQPYEFEPLMKDLLDPQNASTTNTRGSSESNPLIVPNVEAKQFRDFLLALLGRPGEAEYMLLTTGAQYTHNHNQNTFLRYLDIADLAVRFGMSDLAGWAWAQINLLLGSSDTLADSEWDYATLTKIISHLDRIVNGEVRRNLVFFCLLALGGPIKGLVKPEIDAALNAGTCAQFYQLPTLLEADLGKIIFGYAFIAVLSLGHRSSIWVEHLTWQGRATLYAAQVHLNTPSETQELIIEWLREPRKHVIDESYCHACSSLFDAAWQSSFDQCGTLNPIGSPDNISKLLLLPWYQQQFTETVESSPCTCDSRCSDRMLDKIDFLILSLYISLAKKHTNIVNNA